MTPIGTGAFRATTVEAKIVDRDQRIGVRALRLEVSRHSQLQAKGVDGFHVAQLGAERSRIVAERAHWR